MAVDLDASISYTDPEGLPNFVTLNLEDIGLAGVNSLSDSVPGVPYPPGDPDIAAASDGLGGPGTLVITPITTRNRRPGHCSPWGWRPCYCGCAFGAAAVSLNQ